MVSDVRWFSDEWFTEEYLRLASILLKTHERLKLSRLRNGDPWLGNNRNLQALLIRDHCFTKHSTDNFCRKTIPHLKLSGDIPQVRINFRQTNSHVSSDRRTC